jgi:hypothetical protein
VPEHAPSFEDSAVSAAHDDATRSGQSPVAAGVLSPAYCRLCDRRVQPTEPNRCPECGSDLAVPGHRSRSAEATRAMKAAQATKDAFEAARAGQGHTPPTDQPQRAQTPETPAEDLEAEFPDQFKAPAAALRPDTAHYRPAQIRPPRVAQGTAVASPDTRVWVSAVTALFAGAGVLLMVFAPWFGVPDPVTGAPIPGGTFSGWRVTTELTSNGQFPLGTWNFFRDGFSPFFSGLTCMIMGFLVIGAGVILLRSPMIPQPATTSIRPANAHFVRTLGWIAAIPPTVNLVSFFMFPIETNGIPLTFEANYGLFLSAILAVGAAIALHTGCTGSKSRVSWR